MWCTFIPPYMLRRLTLAGATPQHDTLGLDERLRRRRQSPPPTLSPPSAAAAETRVVHDAHSTEELPGPIARQAGDPVSGDSAVDEAWDYSALVWDLFADEFGRRSVDGNATPITVTVHYGQHYDNAFWDGQQLVFGDGDGVVFDRFTKPLDVLAHEFTHGVTQFSAALAYQGQSGALNESVSDVFASLTKQRHLGQSVDQADWLIGAGLFLPGVQARALRSMTEPGTAYDDPQLGRDPQVASMADYVDSDEDSGGVHVNSGIPNRAFALAALALGSYSWQRAGQIWYHALTGGEVAARIDFAGFAQATVGAAARLYPEDTGVADHVRSAWTTVGVPVGSPAPPAGGYSPKEGPTPPAARVAVRRTGGFSGVPRTGELQLDVEPTGQEVRLLLSAIDFEALSSTSPGPDRFHYTVEYGSHVVRVAEPDLTPELHRVVQLVLGQSGSD